jgi:hypothetical protein
MDRRIVIESEDRVLTLRLVGGIKDRRIDCLSMKKGTFPRPCKLLDPDLREVLTSTPWSAILIPGSLSILVILAFLALVLWTK